MVSKRKREEIIRKAEPIFAKYGFKKSTMDNIAENINLKKSTLYYYFKNKEEI
ncbi:MAG: TetR/AcrR family transcriptional regulator, partial [Spirochaetes bacterium]|nr:TetR/AcrR family transcriptional regulator [Spirochaetota bacterium]